MSIISLRRSWAMRLTSCMFLRTRTAADLLPLSAFSRSAFVSFTTLISSSYVSLTSYLSFCKRCDRCSSFLWSGSLRCRNGGTFILSPAQPVAATVTTLPEQRKNDLWIIKKPQLEDNYDQRRDFVNSLFEKKKPMRRKEALDGAPITRYCYHFSIFYQKVLRAGILPLCVSLKSGRTPSSTRKNRPYYFAERFQACKENGFSGKTTVCKASERAAARKNKFARAWSTRQGLGQQELTRTSPQPHFHLTGGKTHGTGSGS